MREGARFPTLGASEAFFIPAAVIPFSDNLAILFQNSTFVARIRHSFFIFLLKLDTRASVPRRKLPQLAQNG